MTYSSNQGEKLQVLHRTCCVLVLGLSNDLSLLILSLCTKWYEPIPRTIQKHIRTTHKHALHRAQVL